jgi:hypothetical protein
VLLPLLVAGCAVAAVREAEAGRREGGGRGRGIIVQIHVFSYLFEVKMILYES